jgi:hypothetical protein
MSRTYKDRPSKLVYDVEPSLIWACYIQVAGARTKKKKHKDTTWHYLRGSPGWWVRLFMTRPQRRAGSLWQRNIEKTPVNLLHKSDEYTISRKPHKYYW